MKTALIVLMDLVILAVIVLIFLKFRFDRIGLRVDMCWRSLRLILGTAAAEMLEQETLSPEKAELVRAFLKCRNQEKQVRYANQLSGFLVVPETDDLELHARWKRYNDTVQQFNEMREKPFWRVIAVTFRIKPRTGISAFQ